jgi:hypothetical protein
MGQAMQDFTELRWQLEDGLNAGLLGKNFFDDFSFGVIPEPSSGLIAGLLGVGMAVRRR